MNRVPLHLLAMLVMIPIEPSQHIARASNMLALLLHHIPSQFDKHVAIFAIIAGVAAWALAHALFGVWWP